MNLITAHPALAAIAAYYLYSAAVGGMPEPSGVSVWYLWLYNTSHILAGNLTLAMQSKFPQQLLPPGSVQLTTTKTATLTPQEK